MTDRTTREADDEPPRAPVDPLAMARRDLQKTLPKRFYKEAAASPRDGAFALLLDGRGAKTPARNPLALPTLAAAKAVAEEWARQVEVIDPRAMPLTRIVNSAIDGVAQEIAATADAIVGYAGADLVCYRAGEPEALAKAQAAAFDPVLAFARDKLGARFICGEGVMHVAQPEAALEATRAAVETFAALGPAAPFALAVARGEMTAAQAWNAAHIDEDFQARVWGAAAEARQRREQRWIEMDAAARLLSAVLDPAPGDAAGRPMP